MSGRIPKAYIAMARGLPCVVPSFDDVTQIRHQIKLGAQLMLRGEAEEGCLSVHVAHLGVCQKAHHELFVVSSLSLLSLSRCTPPLCGYPVVAMLL